MLRAPRLGAVKRQLVHADAALAARGADAGQLERAPADAGDLLRELRAVQADAVPRGRHSLHRHVPEAVRPAAHVDGLDARQAQHLLYLLRRGEVELLAQLQFRRHILQDVGRRGELGRHRAAHLLGAALGGVAHGELAVVAVHGLHNLAQPAAVRRELGVEIPAPHLTVRAQLPGQGVKGVHAVVEAALPAVPLQAAGGADLVRRAVVDAADVRRAGLGQLLRDLADRLRDAAEGLRRVVQLHDDRAAQTLGAVGVLAAGKQPHQPHARLRRNHQIDHRGRRDLVQAGDDLLPGADLQRGHAVGDDERRGRGQAPQRGEQARREPAERVCARKIAQARLRQAEREARGDARHAAAAHAAVPRREQHGHNRGHPAERDPAHGKAGKRKQQDAPRKRPAGDLLRAPLARRAARLHGRRRAAEEIGRRAGQKRLRQIQGGRRGVRAADQHDGERRHQHREKRRARRERRVHAQPGQVVERPADGCGGQQGRQAVHRHRDRRRQQIPQRPAEHRAPQQGVRRRRHGRDRKRRVMPEHHRPREKQPGGEGGRLPRKRLRRPGRRLRKAHPLRFCLDHSTSPP